MPYKNRYNTRIADEIETINQKYISHVGDPVMMGGSLDSGYESKRIVGGMKSGVDEYVRNVLDGTYSIPTQAMPSSSMSGQGMSGAAKKKRTYKKKGSGRSGAGMSGAGVESIKETEKKMNEMAVEEAPSGTEVSGVGGKKTKGKGMSGGGVSGGGVSGGKKVNPWLTHVASVKSQNPSMKYKDVLVLAKQSYKK
jgi:hypothetical protein